jgi:hypothetical protein
MEFEIGKMKIRAYNCTYYHPDDIKDVAEIYPEIKAFHDTYFDGSTSDLPLGYVVCNNRIYAIAVHAHDYGIDIDFVDALEFLSDDS